MRLFRYHSLSALLSVLLLGALSAPSVHMLSHLVVETEVTHSPGEQGQADAPHVEPDCVVCDLAGTLHATTPSASEVPGISYDIVVALLLPAVVVVTPTIHFSSRAPPALPTQIVQA